MTVEVNLKEELQDKLNQKLSKQSLEEYVNFLVKKDLSSYHPMKEGYYIDNYYSKLFNKKDEEILLTKIQYKIIELLVLNKNTILSVEDITKYAWPNNKHVTIFSFRNMIKQIRDKTYYEIIKSHSNRGYEIAD
jgi:DNA-binding response OmpR family regulator